MPRSESEEQRLIQLVVLASDTKAFDMLVAPYAGRLRGYLLSLTRAGSDADDLLQTTLIKAWTELHRFDERGRFVAWLFRIAHREFLQAARSRKRYSKAMTGYGDAVVGPGIESGDGPAAEVDLTIALASLDQESCAMILLSRAVGLTHAEISKTLEKPLGTVKSMINRATKQLVENYG
ncbi:MAG: RNA polymerase sigma factor [Woeseiaceae bacterium]